MFWKKTQIFDSVSVDSFNFKFDIDQWFNVSNIFYKNKLVIHSLSLNDELDERLEQTFLEENLDYDKELFDSITKSPFEFEKNEKTKNTLVFARKKVILKKIIISISIQVEISDSMILFRTHLSSTRNTFYGIAFDIKFNNIIDWNTDAGILNNSINASEFITNINALTSVFDENGKIEIYTTLGSGFANGNNFMFSPTLNATKKETLNSWCIKAAKVNSNVNVLKLRFS